MNERDRRQRGVPIAGCNFRVRFTILGPRGGRGQQRELAFGQVVMPPFRADASEPATADHELPARLVLRRGHTGSSELYEWWRAERDRERRRVREVSVVVLDDAHRPVTGWRFTGCRLVSLEISPLDALVASVLVETVELSFDAVEQFRADA